MSSARVRRTRTGRRVFHAPSAATAAQELACTSLPPNAPPMRRHSTVTWCVGTPEHARDDLLRLGRMLRGGRARRCRRSRPARRWRSASRDRSAPGRRSPARPRRAAALAASAAMSPRARRSGSVRKLPGVDGLLDGEDRRQRLVVDAARARRPRRAASSVSPSTQATGWLWNITSVGKQRLVVPDRARCRSRPGTSAPVSTVTTPGSSSAGAGVERRHARVRVRRQHRPRVQQVRESARARSSV